MEKYKVSQRFIVSKLFEGNGRVFTNELEARAYAGELNAALEEGFKEGEKQAVQALTPTS